jgi:hypothetical protein
MYPGAVSATSTTKKEPLTLKMPKMAPSFDDGFVSREG